MPEWLSFWDQIVICIFLVAFGSWGWVYYRQRFREEMARFYSKFPEAQQKYKPWF